MLGYTFWERCLHMLRDVFRMFSRHYMETKYFISNLYKCVFIVLQGTNISNNYENTSCLGYFERFQFNSSKLLEKYKLSKMKSIYQDSHNLKIEVKQNFTTCNVFERCECDSSNISIQACL